MLHADRSIISLGMEMLENVLVVDLPGGGFLASGRIPHMETTDLIPGTVDIRDQISFRDLLVVDVVDDLAIGAPDSFADL